MYFFESMCGDVPKTTYFYMPRGSKQNSRSRMNPMCRMKQRKSGYPEASTAHMFEVRELEHTIDKSESPVPERLGCVVEAFILAQKMCLLWSVSFCFDLLSFCAR